LSRKPNAGAWISAAFGAALVLAIVVLVLMGNEQRGVVTALRATGRLSYLLFWPAYAGGALARLFGQSFAPIAQRGRCFGLAFAAAHVVHIGLVVRLYQISAEPPVSDAIFLFFAVAVAWTYALALLSFAPRSQATGRIWWRSLRAIGLEYIAFAFFFDFVIAPLRGGVRHPLAYLPFAALAIAGPVLRLAALTARPRRVASP
jgi:hypothetical protein